jgi:succinyl-CoA synthetase beta subunit
MNLHEYQSKQLFARYGIPVPAGYPAHTADDAVEAAKDLGGNGWVVKAQVHAGGRGKAGGVKLTRSLTEVKETAARLLGSRLVTPQTGPEGLPVNTVLVESASQIARELYLSLLVDRSSERIVYIASADGGMDIEAVAAKTPERIFRTVVHPAAGLQPYQARQLGFGLGLTAEQLAPFGRIVQALHKLFVERDASLVEVNPLIVTGDGRVVALDAKVNIEDNALFRQPELLAARDPTQEDEMERAAHQHELNYVSTSSSCTAGSPRTSSTWAAAQRASESRRRSSSSSPTATCARSS